MVTAEFNARDWKVYFHSTLQSVDNLMSASKVKYILLKTEIKKLSEHH